MDFTSYAFQQINKYANREKLGGLSHNYLKLQRCGKNERALRSIKAFILSWVCLVPNTLKAFPAIQGEGKSMFLRNGLLFVF